MPRFVHHIILAGTAALCCGLTSPGWAETAVEGQFGSGAWYRIVVPDDWNEELVIWNHGFSLNAVGPVDDLGPLSDLHLLEGFAVAASSYRLEGWALFKSNTDLKDLVREFSQQFGAPNRIFLYGASLGGAVTAAALEKGGLSNVAGALTLCGAMAGSRNWDAALDLRLLYDLVCSDVPGAAIPGAAKGLPRGANWSDDQVKQAVDACTGVLRPKALRSADQQENLKRLIRTAGIPESFLVQDMQYATRALADLVFDRKKLKGRIGTGNSNVVYGDRFVDENIERVEPKKRFHRRLRRFFTPSGKVGQTKIVSMHTDKDGLVVVENQSAYAEAVPPANLTTAIVVEKRPSHCAFSPPEVVAAWAALRDWVETGDKPTAADIQATCKSLPLFGDICRIDPTFKVPAIDARIRPR